jgi:hypothetical protein
MMHDGGEFMVTVFKNRYGLRYAEVWFPDSGWKKVKSDVIRLHCVTDTKGLKTEALELQHTRLTDLTESIEQLQGHITSKTFRCIRRSYQDDIIIKYFTSEEVCKDPKIVYAFAEFYHAMFAEKGIEAALDTAAVLRCAKVGALVISAVYLYSEPIVFHSYIDGKDKAICWHSCSKCRSEDEIANIIGRANKRLHWEDWLYFKARGCATYDWGGVFAFDSENGIDRFKMLFGGAPHDYYNTIPLPNSILGKITLRLYALLRFVNPMSAEILKGGPIEFRCRRKARHALSAHMPLPKVLNSRLQHGQQLR